MIVVPGDDGAEAGGDARRRAVNDPEADEIGLVELFQAQRLGGAKELRLHGSEHGIGGGRGGGEREAGPEAREQEAREQDEPAPKTGTLRSSPGGGRLSNRGLS